MTAAGGAGDRIGYGGDAGDRGERGNALRIGVVGTGVMGADHARTVARSVGGARLTAVNDLDTVRAKEAVAGLGDVAVCTDPYALIDDDSVDAVVVASADTTHEALVLACIAAGKPVLCEKPLTPDAEGSLRIVAADDRHFEATGRRLVSVGFMRRHDPGYLELKTAVDDARYGSPLLLHCVHRNATSRPNAPSTALLTGSAVHEIDIARWLLGEELISAAVHRPRRSSLVAGATQDPLVVLLESESGVLIDVEVFVNCQYGYDVRCELVAERGAMAIDRPTAAVTRTGRVLGREVAADWRDRFADAYRIQLQDWVAGIESGTQRLATAWDGYAATAVASACVRALETGEPTGISLAARDSAG